MSLGRRFKSLRGRVRTFFISHLSLPYEWNLAGECRLDLLPQSQNFGEWEIRNQELRGPKVISERWPIFAKRMQSDTQRLYF
jgi:hypothetical protein